MINNQDRFVKPSRNIEKYEPGSNRQKAGKVLRSFLDKLRGGEIVEKSIATTIPEITPTPQTDAEKITQLQSELTKTRADLINVLTTNEITVETDVKEKKPDHFVINKQAAWMVSSLITLAIGYAGYTLGNQTAEVKPPVEFGIVEKTDGHHFIRDKYGKTHLLDIKDNESTTKESNMEPKKIESESNKHEK
jgi:hypothetical protein